MKKIVLSRVCKRFGEQAVVHELDLEMADSEFVVLVGPSGCGKSTTLRMLAGLEEVSSGTIHIGGRDVTRLQPGERNIAMVFQNYALYPHKTVRENLAFGLRMRKVPAAEIESKVRWAAEMLGIENLLGRKPRELSGGQMQRVSLGRALVRSPEVFLLDEPLSNLDAKLRIRMREEIAQLHRRVATNMVYVTHDQVEAMTLGDRIVIMNQGQVQQVGRPLEVYDRPANLFVAGFIGAPEMNLIKGRLRTSAGRLIFDAPGLHVPIDAPPAKARPDSEVVLGFRPEHARMTGEETDGNAGTVVLVEQLGAQTLTMLETFGAGMQGKGTQGAAPAHIRVLSGRRNDVRPGDRARISLDYSRIHLFDATSGANLEMA